MNWLEAQWQAFLASFDADEVAEAGSSPIFTIAGVGALSLVLAIPGYVPPVAKISQFAMPEVCLALALAGGVCSFTAGRFKCRGLVGGFCTLFDNILYSASLALAAVTSRNGFDVAFAVVHGLMVTAFPAQLYGLSLLLGLGLTLPPMVLLLVFRPAPAVIVIMVCVCLMVLLAMYQTGKRQEVTAHARRLEAQLKESIAQLRVAKERDRIARDLHDGVGAQLAGLIWRVRGLASHRESRPSPAELETLERRVRDTIEEMRDVVLALRREPMSWDETTALITQRLQLITQRLQGDVREYRVRAPCSGNARSGHARQGFYGSHADSLRTRSPRRTEQGRSVHRNRRRTSLARQRRWTRSCERGCSEEPGRAQQCAAAGGRHGRVDERGLRCEWNAR